MNNHAYANDKKTVDKVTLAEFEIIVRKWLYDQHQGSESLKRAYRSRRGGKKFKSFQ